MSQDEEQNNQVEKKSKDAHQKAEDQAKPLDLLHDADQIEDGSILSVIRRSTGEVVASAVIRKPKKP